MNLSIQVIDPIIALNNANLELTEIQKKGIYQILSIAYFSKNYYFLFDQLAIGRLIRDLDLDIARKLFDDTPNAKKSRDKHDYYGVDQYNSDYIGIANDVTSIFRLPTTFFDKNKKAERKRFNEYIQHLDENVVKVILANDFPGISNAYEIFNECYEKVLLEIKTNPNKSTKNITNILVNYSDVVIQNCKKNNYKGIRAPMYKFYVMLLDYIEEKIFKPQVDISNLSELFKTVSINSNQSNLRKRNYLHTNIKKYGNKANEIFFTVKQKDIDNETILNLLIDSNINNYPFIIPLISNMKYISILYYSEYSYKWSRSKCRSKYLSRGMLINTENDLINLFKRDDIMKYISESDIDIKRLLFLLKNDQTSDLLESYFKENKTEEDKLYLKLKYNIDNIYN